MLDDVIHRTDNPTAKLASRNPLANSKTMVNAVRLPGVRACCPPASFVSIESVPCQGG